jgi:hypothetical protein
VTDQNGAAVSGATVKLINQATRIESQAKPNQSGYFIFVNVMPAPTFSESRPRASRRRKFPPSTWASARPRRRNVALTVGEVSQTVEVAANAELLQSSSSELGTVITEKVVRICL